ncbi:MAG: hypothetical protein AB2A00_35255 [Myxococcota bacterium]
MHAWLLLVGALAVQGTHTAPRRVLIMQFDAPVTLAETAHRAEQAFRDQAERLPGYKVVSAAETQTLLEQATAAGWSCTTRPACYTQIQALLAADVIIIGEVVSQGSERVANVALYEMQGGQVTPGRAGSVTLTDEGFQLSAAMREVAVQLLSPDLYRGAVDVVCEAGSDTTVWLRSNQVAACPATARVPEAPGMYRLTVVRGQVEQPPVNVDVRYERATVVRIAADGTVKVDADTRPYDPLSNASPPPDDGGTSGEGGPGPLLYVGAGSAVAGVVVFVVGVVTAVAAAGLTAVWPRTSPLVGKVTRFPGEPTPVAVLRVLGVAGLVPAGALVGMVGAVLLMAGAGMAVASVAVGQE